jgi:hypothetical protein
MAVSFDTWRRIHGFSEADAPSPEEVALRMIIEKGAITPELTEAVIGAIAPELMASTRSAQQANSVAPMPPELQQLLQGGPPAGESPQAPPPTGLLEPTTEETAPPAPTEQQG